MLFIFVLTAAYASADASTGYVKIILNKEKTLYVQFQDDELKMATSVADLKDAKIINAAESSKLGGTTQQDEYSQIALPLTAKELPSGIQKIAVKITHIYDTGDEALGLFDYAGIEFIFSKKGPAGVLWEYSVETGTEVKSSAAKALNAELPDISQPKIVLEVQPKESRQVGVAIQIRSKKFTISAIKQAGKDATAYLKVLDKDGKTVNAANGPLSKFGYT